MNSIYQDERLRADCAEAVRAFLSMSPEGLQHWLAFQDRLLGRVYESLGGVIRSGVPQWVNPPLLIHPPDDALNGSDLYIDADGVHAGAGLFQRLAFHLLQFSHFLMQNFIWQISGPMGACPPLADVVSLDDFPLQALTFHAASLVPGAVNRSGFARSTGTMLLEWLQDLTFSTTSDPGRLSSELSRRVVKPAARDLLMYSRAFQADPSPLLEAYDDAGMAPYLQRLFWQLLLDGMHFLLAHELAHRGLGHNAPDAPPTAAQSQEQESQTDELALCAVREIPGFLLPSLLLLFAFCAGQEPDVPLHEMDHPFSHDRLLHLAMALLREPQAEDLYLNLNAGMAFLAAPLPVMTLRLRWDDGFVETGELEMQQYADLDYNAHLLLYLERPPRLVDLPDGGRENAWMLCQYTFQADVLLRDRIHPAQVYHGARVRFRPGGVPDDMMFQYGTDRVLTRLHLQIPAPVEWWLGHPDAELVIENVQQADEPLDEWQDDEGNYHHNLRYDAAPLAFDHGAFLQALPAHSSDADPLTRHMVLLAARRFVELSAPQLALAYYNWLYVSDDSLVQYPEQIDICQALLETQQWEGLEAVARNALERLGNELLPGFHIYLCACLQQRGALGDALEQAFIEQFGVGNFGRFIDFARASFWELLHTDADLLMRCVRGFIEDYAEAEKAAEECSEQATALLERAMQNLREARLHDSADHLFLREYEAEAQLALSRLQHASLAAPRALFEDIRRREPWFVPARIQLARIALLEGDHDRASAIWLEARRLTPFLHHMVFDFREAIDQPNPNVVLTSRPVHPGAAGPEEANQE